MRSNSSVRRPALANSNTSGIQDDVSIGEKLRKAKKDLFFSRCVCGILLVLLVTAIACAFLLGYVSEFVDYLFAIIG